MDLNDVKGALDELSHSMRETIGNIKTDEAHVAEVAARAERRKRELTKLLRTTATDIRKIMTAS